MFINIHKIVHRIVHISLHLLHFTNHIDIDIENTVNSLKTARKLRALLKNVSHINSFLVLDEPLTQFKFQNSC